MSASNSTQWFWSDWGGDPCVRRLTPAERGLWIDLLSFAAAGVPVGYVVDQQGSPISYEEIARFTNATPTEVATLIDGILAKGAASRDRTGRLFNRRMVRKSELSAKRKRNGKAGALATQLKWQAFQGLPRQNAWQVPGDRETTLTKSKIITSEYDAARPRPVDRVDKSEEDTEGKPRKPPQLIVSPELVATLSRRKTA